MACLDFWWTEMYLSVARTFFVRSARVCACSLLWRLSFEFGFLLELQYQLLVKSDQASSGWVSAYRTLAVCTRFRFFSHDAGAHIHDRDDDFGSVRCGYRWWLVCSAVLSRDRARSILMQMSH